MEVYELAAGRGHRSAIRHALIGLVRASGIVLAWRASLPAHSFRKHCSALGIGIALVLFFFSSHPLLASDLKEPKRVLILYSFEWEQTAAAAALQESLHASLKSRVPNRIEFYSEYLDLTRFSDPGHVDNMVKSLRLRIAPKKLDLILAVGDTALNFVLSNERDLFPGTPIVSLFGQEFKLGPEQRALTTGVQSRIDTTGTLDLALQLQPDTQRVVVVTGDSPDEKFWLQRLRTDFAGYGGRVAFTYLTDLPMEGILARLAELPPHTIVFYPFFIQDARGRFFIPEEALDLIVNTSHVPIYGIYSSYVGHGIVGGRMDALAKNFASMAGLAARVLNGEKPGDIPLIVESSGHDLVDWHQLKRWGISEQRLPPGTVVLFKEPSLWEEYRAYIIGVFFLLILQAGLILALLVQRQHRRQAEKRLMSEKAFSDAVIESLPGVFLMQDETHKNIRWNKESERLAHHPLTTSRLDNVPAKYQSAARQLIRQVFEHGFAPPLEFEVLVQGGGTVFYQFIARRVEFGNKPYIIALGIDISDRKRAEDELRISEARFASAFEYAPIGVALVAPEGRWIKVNRALCELLGYTHEELQAKTFQDVTHPDDLQADLNYVRQILASEIPSYRREKRYLHKSGRVVWVWLSVSLLRDSEGQPLYFISQILDITERKRAEEELKLAEERFAKAFQSNPLGFIISRARDGRILEVNEAFLHMMGYGREELIGKTTIELRIWEGPEERSATIGKLLAVGSIKEEDAKFRTKDGRMRQVRLSAEIVQLQGELCILGLSRDVTEHNLLEEQYRQAQKMEAVGRLAAGIAHDFNNLLGVIIGYSELVSSGLAADSLSYKRVEAIKQAGQRAAALTTQLLAFSRKQTVQPRVVNLNSVVRESEKLLRPTLGEDIELSIILDPKLGQVKADAAQIVQVLMNLSVNARDAMPQGGKLVIETANETVDGETLLDGIPVQPGLYVSLTVRDTGTGMDEATKARIFEPFYTTKSAGKGTGLGLATVYGIVEQNGGSILVNTAVGKGSTFKIYLPRIAEVAETPAVTTAPAKPVRASGTILLVEDEMGLRSVIDESLRQWGYRVLLASNGMEALEVAAEHKGPIQLLITDVIMPFISGPQLAQSLKPLRPEIRVLYISGYTADKFADYPELDPHLALLQKPFKLVDLAQKVRDLLNESRESVSANQSTIQP